MAAPDSDETSFREMDAETLRAENGWDHRLLVAQYEADLAEGVPAKVRQLRRLNAVYKETSDSRKDLHQSQLNKLKTRLRRERRKLSQEQMRLRRVLKTHQDERAKTEAAKLQTPEYVETNHLLNACNALQSFRRFHRAAGHGELFPDAGTFVSCHDLSEAKIEALQDKMKDLTKMEVSGGPGEPDEGRPYLLDEACDDIWPSEANRDGACGLAGSKGNVGDRGHSGAAGFPGPNGVGGASGAPGPKGDNGVVPGYPGLRGSLGPIGKGGLSGPPGAGGEGTDGASGKGGLSGPPGAGGEGTDGASGKGGLSGPPSAGGEGNAGPPGSPGRKGDNGLSGYPGVRGIPGANGRGASRRGLAESPASPSSSSSSSSSSSDESSDSDDSDDSADRPGPSSRYKRGPLTSDSD